MLATKFSNINNSGNNWAPIVIWQTCLLVLVRELVGVIFKHISINLLWNIFPSSLQCKLLLVEKQEWPEWPQVETILKSFSKWLEIWKIEDLFSFNIKKNLQVKLSKNAIKIYRRFSIHSCDSLSLVISIRSR